MATLLKMSEEWRIQSMTISDRFNHHKREPHTSDDPSFDYNRQLVGYHGTAYLGIEELNIPSTSEPCLLYHAYLRIEELNISSTSEPCLLYHVYLRIGRFGQTDDWLIDCKSQVYYLIIGSVWKIIILHVTILARVEAFTGGGIRFYHSSEGENSAFSNLPRRSAQFYQILTHQRS